MDYQQVGGRWCPRPASHSNSDIEVDGPSDEDILDSVRKCIPRNAAPYDEVRIDVGLLWWLIHKVEMGDYDG